MASMERRRDFLLPMLILEIHCGACSMSTEIQLLQSSWTRDQLISFLRHQFKVNIFMIIYEEHKFNKLYLSAVPQPQVIANDSCDSARRSSIQLANEANQTNSRPTHRMSNVSLQSNSSNNASRRLTVYNPRSSMEQIVQIPAPEYPGQHPVVSMMLPEFSPMQMHSMTGRNVMTSTDRTIVSRIETEFCQGYVFTQRPIRYGEQFIIQILKTENIYGGSLAIGLTACNPSTLSMGELPDDSDLLLDRPEYWVVSKDVGQIVSMKAGDEIKFQVTSAGEVQISRLVLYNFYDLKEIFSFF